jgi:hypothetical protein
VGSAASSLIVLSFALPLAGLHFTLLTPVVLSLVDVLSDARHVHIIAHPQFDPKANQSIVLVVDASIVFHFDFLASSWISQVGEAALVMTSTS